MPYYRDVRTWTCWAAALLAAGSSGAGLLRAQRYQFRSYGQEDGLTSQGVAAILQDREGFLWVATEHGVFRYDGGAFRMYGQRDGLPNAMAQGLVEGPDGVLWVATPDGLAWRDGERFVAAGVRVAVHMPRPMASDSKGTLYAATAGGLLASAPEPHPSRRRFVRVEAAGGAAPVVSVFVDAQDRVWFGCASAICRLEGGRLVRFGETEGVPRGSWRSYAVDSSGALWAQSPQMLLSLEPGGGKRFVVRNAEIPEAMQFGPLATDHRGRLMVPSDAGLVRQLTSRPGWQTLNPSRGLEGSVHAAYEDREGSLWIAAGGLKRWIGTGDWCAWTTAEGLAHTDVWSVSASQGGWWVGTGKGIQWMDQTGRLERPKAVPEPRDPQIGWTSVSYSTAVDGAGGLWFTGTFSGVARYDPHTRRIRIFGVAEGVPKTFVRRVRIDGEGGIWLATLAGAYYGSGRGDQVTFREVVPAGGKAGQRYTELIVDRAGNLWLCGPEGIQVRVRQAADAAAPGEGGVWRQARKADGLHYNAMGALAADSRGNLWGIYRNQSEVVRLVFEAGRPVVKQHLEDAELASVGLYSIAVDATDRLWVGTSSGVRMYDGQRWRRFTRANGLVWDDCSEQALFTEADGTVWIGTSGGLSRYRVEEPERRLPPPPVQITRTLLGGKPADLRSPPAVPFSERALDVEFAGLTFRDESQVRFRHRLIGLEEEFTESGRREVRYRALPAGHYVFEVTAGTPDTGWSGRPARFAFTVRPAWYASVWFVMLATSALAGAVAFGWRLRMRYLLRRQHQLETAVEERTAELHTEKARVEELLGQAREASRVKSSFLASMSHEIRTPINGVLLAAELALDTVPTGEQRDYLETIRVSGASLLALVNDILDFSKIEAGHMQLSPVDFCLRQLVDECLRVTSIQARRKGLALTARWAEGMDTWVRGDSSRLRQVLLNLLSNAIKFTERGSVEVRAEVVDAAGRMYLLSVTDTGIGIPADKQALVFGEFQQADGSTTRRYGGTGLGLAISRRLVGLMGGEMRLESVPGQGSTFYLTIRFEAPSAPKPVCRRSGETRPAEAAVSLEEGNAPAAGLHLLVAEDNAVNQKLILRVLEKLGHRVVVAETGVQATALATSGEGSFDAVLMDVQMPEMDGLEATRQIREFEEGTGRHLPILAMTANATRDDEALCLTAGMDGYLSKPVNTQDLAIALERVAAGGETRPAHSSAAARRVCGALNCPERERCRGEGETDDCVTEALRVGPPGAQRRE